nr:hypothetical protein [uncultured Treponema sp.]
MQNVIKIRENACVLTIYLEKFGNGLLVAYSDSDCPKPFVGKAYTFNGTDNDKLQIGRWS